MVKDNSISDYFKRIDSNQDETQQQSPNATQVVEHEDLPTSSASSSRLSSPPEFLSSSIKTPQASPAKENLYPGTAKKLDYTSFDGSLDQHRLASSFASASSSQRVVKGGQVVITGSDDDADSIVSSFESPDELLGHFMTPQRDVSPERASSDKFIGHSKDMGSPSSREFLKPKQRKPPTSATVPKYKFSLDALVNNATEDLEREARISKAKNAIDSSKPKQDDTASSKGPALRDDILVSVVPDDTDTVAIQRLKNAVTRTETLSQGQSWSFFQNELPSTPPVPKFPKKLILPGSWESVLCDPSSRDRAFFSGIVGESLAGSGSNIPDEILLWIYQAVTTEPRNELRYAYCSTLKVAPAERISSLLRPPQIDQMFQSVGAKPSALATSDPIRPNSFNINSSTNPDNKFLLSALDLLCALANKLNNDTREHALKVLLRLSIDEASMNDCAVCVETQQGIVSLLGKADGGLPDLTIYEVSMHIYKTIKEVELQSQLLKNILPVTSKIALFRCRLAAAFLFEDPSLLDRPIEHLFDLKRISARLKEDKRFNVKGRHSRADDQINYWQLSALTSILDTAIDSGTSKSNFPSKAAESEFNRDVDELADRINHLFTSIQDSGASHLKRTETKEALQALYYRLIYGVRTKPQPKKLWFRASSKDDGQWSPTSKDRSSKVLTSFVKKQKALPDE